MSTRANDLFREGRLSEALLQATEDVRARPTDAEARFVLFMLFVFAGDLKRAALQLGAVISPSPAWTMRSAHYTSLLAAEVERRAIWDGEARPLLSPGDHPALDLRLAAIAHLRTNDLATARERFARADAEARRVAGKIDTHAFEEIRDTDERLGPVIEAYAGGRCLWIGFEEVRRLVAEPIREPLDLLWRPVRYEDARGNDAMVYLPALYAGSASSTDDELRLGRKTEWEETAAGPLAGRGQRIWSATSSDGEVEVPLLDLHVLEVAG